MGQSALRHELVDLIKHENAIRELAADMREIDVKEGLAMGATSALDTLTQSLMSCHAHRYMVFDGETPLCAFGLREGKTELGTLIWFLGSKRLDEYKREFVKQTREVIMAWVKEHGKLYNYVSVDNEKSITWLKGLGAKLYPPFVAGRNGEAFILFTIGGNDDV